MSCFLTFLYEFQKVFKYTSSYFMLFSICLTFLVFFFSNMLCHISGVFVHCIIFCLLCSLLDDPTEMSIESSGCIFAALVYENIEKVGEPKKIFSPLSSSLYLFIQAGVCVWILVVSLFFHIKSPIFRVNSTLLRLFQIVVCLYADTGRDL